MGLCIKGSSFNKLGSGKRFDDDDNRDDDEDDEIWDFWKSSSSLSFIFDEDDVSYDGINLYIVYIIDYIDNKYWKKKCIYVLKYN